MSRNNRFGPRKPKKPKLICLPGHGRKETIHKPDLKIMKPNTRQPLDEKIIGFIVKIAYKLKAIIKGISHDNKP